jgi:hypothetical protein
VTPMTMSAEETKKGAEEGGGHTCRLAQGARSRQEDWRGGVWPEDGRSVPPLAFGLPALTHWVADSLDSNGEETISFVPLSSPPSVRWITAMIRSHGTETLEEGRERRRRRLGGRERDWCLDLTGPS